MNSIAILMYHSLDESRSVLSVTPGIFERQMASLAEHGLGAITLRDALAIRQHSGRWPQDSVVITFDDGFANVHQHALPVLRRYSFAATVFAVSDHVGGTDNWQAPSGERGPLMNWNELSQLMGHGLEIGAHSVSHADLSQLAPQDAAHEMAQSARTLGQRLGQPITSFAYPFGRATTQVTNLASQMFQGACTTEHRRAGDDAPALLPRVEMYYFRHYSDLGPLVAGHLDRTMTLRRWARGLRQRVTRGAA